jgi:hypothetical protein
LKVKKIGLKDFLSKHRNLIIVALGLLMVPSYFIYDYTQNNPKFCTTCHLMNEAYETWDASAMHDLNCHHCHETDMIESLDHVREVIFEKPTEVTKMTEVDNELCEKCHASDDPQWLQVEATAGHKVHFFESDEAPDCIDCHGLQLHVFRPPEETCDTCHEEDLDEPCDDMRVHCTVCHEFNVAEDDLIPARDDCLECHEAQDTMGVTFPVGSHSNTPCLSCHNPHDSEQQSECTTCHPIPSKGLHNETAHVNCEACHTPHSDTPMRDSCLICHQDKEEHYAPADCVSCHSFGS